MAATTATTIVWLREGVGLDLGFIFERLVVHLIVIGKDRIVVGKELVLAGDLLGMDFSVVLVGGKRDHRLQPFSGRPCSVVAVAKPFGSSAPAFSFSSSARSSSSTS